MDRCKLEYMLRYIDPDKKWDIIEAVDPENKYMFNFLAVKLLKNPDTQNKFTLMVVPNSDNPENVKKYLDEFRTQFHKINEMCKENKIYPFFENPNDVRDSELTREDICLLVPEKELNNFFGVNSFYEYRPPVFEPEKVN